MWDLNHATNPMTPGAKQQPIEDITCVSWNRQVRTSLCYKLSNGMILRPCVIMSNNCVLFQC